MFKNKHVVIALLVAPILALISYFSIDAMVSETPHAALEGQQYQLVEKPNCRYSSGHCQLKNGDFELTLSAQWLEDEQLQILLTSDYALDGVILAVANSEHPNGKPVNMYSQDQAGTKWSITIPKVDAQTDRLNIAASANKTLYFGDAALAFIEYQTSFEQDFRQ